MSPKDVTSTFVHRTLVRIAQLVVTGLARQAYESLQEHTHDAQGISLKAHSNSWSLYADIASALAVATGVACCLRHVKPLPGGTLMCVGQASERQSHLSSSIHSFVFAHMHADFTDASVFGLWLVIRCTGCRRNLLPCPAPPGPALSRQVLSCPACFCPVLPSPAVDAVQVQGEGEAGDSLLRVGGAHSCLDQVGHSGQPSYLSPAITHDHSIWVLCQHDS